MDRQLPKRRANRLIDYDYSQNGAYFITVCSKDKQCIFGEVVGAGVPDRPYVELTEVGKCIAETIEFQNNKDNIIAEKYIIMPNHIHFIMAIVDSTNGRSGTPAPTIGQIVGQFKSYVVKQLGYEVWQKGFYDHIIRDQKDYDKIWYYIDTNPERWVEDKYYSSIK